MTRHLLSTLLSFRTERSESETCLPAGILSASDCHPDKRAGGTTVQRTPSERNPIGTNQLLRGFLLTVERTSGFGGFLLPMVVPMTTFCKNQKFCILKNNLLNNEHRLTICELQKSKIVNGCSIFYLSCHITMCALFLGVLGLERTTLFLSQIPKHHLVMSNEERHLP